MSELEPRLELGADAWEVMASSSAPVFVFSLADHRILAVSGAFTRMYGYTAEEATGLRIEDLIPEGERHVAAGETTGGGGDLTDPGDWHHRTKDGSLVPVVISASDMTWGGTPCRVAAVTDISRLKQVETRLRREESLSDLASRLAKVGGWSLDPATGEGEWSDEVYRIHDLEPAQPGAAADWSIFTAEDRARVEEFNAGVVRDRTPRDMEIEMTMAGGDVKCLRVTARPVVEGGRVVRLEGATQDVTDLKRAMERAREDEVVLASLFQVIPDLYFEFDEDTVIRHYHADDKGALYVPPEVFLGKPVEEVLPPDVAAAFRFAVGESGRTGGLVVFEYDLPVQGSPRHFECRVSRLAHDRRSVAIIRDMTEQHRAQQALLASERRLGERVKEQHCLYEVYRLTEDEDPDLDEVVPQIVATLKQSWQYPDITQVRVCWAGKDYATSGFRETPWMQSAVARTKRGEELSVTVAYAEEAPAEAEGPFLAEERTLIDAVATRLVDTADWAAAYNERLEHEQLLTTMFAQSTDAIIIVDPGTGEFVDFNLEAHAALGYSREEFRRMRIEDFQAEYDSAEIGDIVDKARAGALVDLQTRHRHKDGRILDAEATIRGVTIKGRPLLSATWRDVTDQRVREQELLETAERLRLHNELLGLLSASQAAANGEFTAFAAELTELISRSDGAPFVSVWLFCDDESRLECVDAYDRAAGTHTRDLVIETAEFPAEIAAHKAARYIDAADALSDQRTAGFAAGLLQPDSITALLDCAVISAGRVRGVFSVGQVGGAYDWPGDRIAFACQVADQLGMALLNRDRLATARKLDEYRLHLEDLVAARTADLEAARAEPAAERRQDAP